MEPLALTMMCHSTIQNFLILSAMVSYLTIQDCLIHVSLVGCVTLDCCREAPTDGNTASDSGSTTQHSTEGNKSKVVQIKTDYGSKQFVMCVCIEQSFVTVM